MVIAETKRVSFKCENDVYKQLEYLKTFYDSKRDEVLTTVITERYREILANLALEAGLLEKEEKQEIILKRDDFVTQNESSAFDRICKNLNVKGDDGEVSSVEQIKIEVKSLSVVSR